MTSTSNDAALPGASKPRGKKAASAGITTLRAGIGGLLGLVGIAILAAGVALVGVYAFARDDDGYYQADTESLQSDSYAVLTEKLSFGVGPIDAPAEVLGKSRLTVEGEDGQSIFVGVGPTAAVDQYLLGVSHAQVAELGNGALEYDLQPGRAPASLPASQDFWMAQTAGAGRQVLDWDVEEGEWTAVVMNANGSRDVAVDTTAAIKNRWLIWAAIGMVVFGILAIPAAARILRPRR